MYYNKETNSCEEICEEGEIYNLETSKYDSICEKKSI